MLKTRPVKLAPSILTADFAHLADEIQAAEAGGADLLHLDVMDGRFVPNITFGPLVVEAVRKLTKLPLDVHLMIDAPERYLADFAKAGADNLTVQVEACLHLHNTVQKINELGCRASVALNPATAIESVREILPFIDMVLVMSVDPGFGGQKFIENTYSKITELKRMITEHNAMVMIEIDGGVDLTNYKKLITMGADVLVAGNTVFTSPDPTETIAILKKG